MLTLCLAATYTEGEWWVTIASPIVAGSAQCEELLFCSCMQLRLSRSTPSRGMPVMPTPRFFLWRCKLLSESAVPR